MSAFNFFSTISGSAPVLQSPSTKSLFIFNFSAISHHLVENSPVSNINTLSPSLSVFTIAASQAPVPEPGYIMTGSDVLNISLILSSTLFAISANSGPR